VRILDFTAEIRRSGAQTPSPGAASRRVIDPPRSTTMAKGQQQPKNVKKPKLSIQEKQDKKKAKLAKKNG